MSDEIDFDISDEEMNEFIKEVTSKSFDDWYSEEDDTWNNIS